MTAPGRAATSPKRRRRTAIGAGLGLAVLIASSPACAAFIEMPTNQASAQSGAPPRRLAPVERGPIKPPPVAQSSANPRRFRPAPPPPPRPKPSPMPNLTGMPLALAMAILARQGLAASQVSPTASDAPANWVVGQQPFPQAPVTPGARIVLTVSNGPPRPVQPLPPPRPVQPPPPPIFPPRRPPPPPPNGFNGGVPVQPPAAAPSPPAPAAPPTLESPPVAPAPVRPKPPSSAPAPSAAPVASAAPSNAGAPSAANPAVPPAPVAPVAPPNPGPTDQADALGWARAHPGWLAALVAALAAGAAGLGWALRRRPPVIPSGPVLPVAPVIVTASMVGPPHSEIQNVQPPPGPAIGLSWRIDPPEARLEGPSQTTEEPKP